MPSAPLIARYEPFSSEELGKIRVNVLIDHAHYLAVFTGTHDLLEAQAAWTRLMNDQAHLDAMNAILVGRIAEAQRTLA